MRDALLQCVPRSNPSGRRSGGGGGRTEPSSRPRARAGRGVGVAPRSVPNRLARVEGVPALAPPSRTPKPPSVRARRTQAASRTRARRRTEGSRETARSGWVPRKRPRRTTTGRLGLARVTSPAFGRAGGGGGGGGGGGRASGSGLAAVKEAAETEAAPKPHSTRGTSGPAGTATVGTSRTSTGRL